MEKTIKIFSILVQGRDEPKFVEAEDMEEAIYKFKRYIDNSDGYYYTGREIHSVTLAHELDVIS